MKKTLLVSAAILSLSACATMLDDQTQNMTIRTPGVEKAKCTIQNPDFKYVAWSNQEIEIMKSPHDLVINCKADHNREQTVHVKREINEWVIANVANGFVPGATYDYFSRGGFDYPDEITVSFVGMKPQPYPGPSYEADPFHKIETLQPGVIINENNRHDKPHKLEKLDTLYESDFDDGESTDDSSSSSYKGDSLHRQYNPAVYNPTEEDK